MMGISVLSVACMCVARQSSRDGRCGKVWENFSDMPSRILLHGIMKDRPKAFMHQGSVAALLITQVVFVPLRLDGATRTLRDMARPRVTHA